MGWLHFNSPLWHSQKFVGELFLDSELYIFFAYKYCKITVYLLLEYHKLDQKPTFLKMCCFHQEMLTPSYSFQKLWFKHGRIFENFSFFLEANREDVNGSHNKYQREKPAPWNKATCAELSYSSWLTSCSNKFGLAQSLVSEALLLEPQIAMKRN